MKSNPCEHCPCCGRHCRRDNLHCKRGVAYFDKLEGRPETKKWERDLEPDGLMRRFIHAGRGMKKGVQRKKISEEAFLAALSASEQLTLDEILNNLEPLAQKSRKGERRHAR